MAEVERDGPLVEIVEPEEEAAVAMRDVICERANLARVVAAGRLDLDYVGAHIGQQATAQLPAKIGQVEDLESRERPRLIQRVRAFRQCSPAFPTSEAIAEIANPHPYIR